MRKRKVNYKKAVLIGIFNFAVISTLYDLEKGVGFGIGATIGTILCDLTFGDPLADDELPEP